MVSKVAAIRMVLSASRTAGHSDHTPSADNGVVGGVTAMLPFQRKFFPTVYEHSTTGAGGPQTADSAYCESFFVFRCFAKVLLR